MAGNNRWLFLIILALIILIIVIDVGYIFFGKKLPLLKTFYSKPISTPIPATISGSISRNLPNVLYPRYPDPSGRNIYYITQDLGKNIRYSGAGVIMLHKGDRSTDQQGKVLQEVKKDNSMTNYVVGSFISWEKIPGSNDRYLNLKDLLRVRNEKGELILIPKIRVGFSTRDINYQKDIYGTAFGVENLSSVIPKVTSSDHKVEILWTGLIGALDSKDLDLLIKPNDTVVITFIANFAGQTDLVDSKQIKVASRLLIRRFDPKNSIFKELDKKLELYYK